MTHYEETKKQLKFGIILNGAFTLIELIGGLLSNSLALISDAMHDFADTAALALSYFANYKAQQYPTKEKTFGYHRASILAAFINASFLVAITIIIFYRAYLRILKPEPVHGLTIFLIAVFGALINGAIALRMWKSKDKDINLKSIFWHISEDALGWVGVIIAGLVIMYTGWYVIDPIISILIGLIVLYGAWEIIKETTNILLEGTPEHIDIDKVIKKIKSIPNINDVHDTHIWTLGSDYYALSTHVSIPNMKINESYNVLCKINKILKKEFNITHTTIEFECYNCSKDLKCN